MLVFKDYIEQVDYFLRIQVRAAALISATIVAPEIALYHINSRYKEYSKVPDQVKQLNYLIPNFDIDDNGNQILDEDVPFIAIPKPYDLGVFANVAVGLMDGMYKRSDGVTKNMLQNHLVKLHQVYLYLQV